MGDELFKLAFKALFPKIHFTFVNKLYASDIAQHNIIIFGGGSFLYSHINTDCSSLFDILSKKDIYYIGVGIETNIHPIHQKLLRQAKLIAPRTIVGADRIRQITNSKILIIPDLVYALYEKSKYNNVIPNSILILPNAEILPHWNDINWKHTSWNYFKSEFAQTLDELKELKYKIMFAPMCINNDKNDLGAIAEIINNMTHRNFSEQIKELPIDFSELTNIISTYELIISQRFHGSILAHICKRPCITIAHHDKLISATDSSITIPYYEMSKKRLHTAIVEAKKIKIQDINFPKLEL